MEAKCRKGIDRNEQQQKSAWKALAGRPNEGTAREAAWQRGAEYDYVEGILTYISTK